MKRFENLKERWQDEALVKEFRKIAQLCNLDVSYFGNVMSQRRIKWCKPIEKYHGRNLKYIPLIMKECKKYKISAVTILSPNLWIGDYGKILCAAERLSMSDFRDYCISDSKYVWKTIRNLYNSHNSKKWETYQFDDGTFHYYYMPTGHSKIKYGSSEWDELIVLNNGQVFDVGNVYWFNIEDSHKLTREIKRGYQYIEPQYFFQDFDDYIEEDEEEYEEDEE